MDRAKMKPRITSNLIGQIRNRPHSVGSFMSALSLIS